MKTTDKSGLLGKFQSWLYQQRLLPRLMWFLIVYKVQLTAVEGVERKIIEHLRSWLQVLLQSGSTSGQLQLLCHLSLQSSKWQMQVCLHLQRFKRQQGQRSRLKTTSGQEWKDSKSLVQEKGIFKIQLYSSTLCRMTKSGHHMLPKIWKSLT